MRADLYLTRLGHAKSRQAAQKLIADGAVLIDDVLVIKPATEIREDESHTVRITKTERYVSRGGLKLEHALDVFGVDVRGVCAMDIGASTGGFTDCLLQRGAERVFAIDSGTGQLDPSLEADGRVHSMTGYNARHLSREDFDCLADLVVADVSFISQTYIIPNLPSVMKPEGLFIGLIKPQFEAGRGALNKHGVVKHAKDRAFAIRRVLGCAAEHGLFCIGLTTSPIVGGDGNVEYLALFGQNRAATVYEVDINTIAGV